MVSPPKRLTTAQLRAMIAGGAKREDLPTKANGRSVSSTRESAQSAYRKQLDKIERTKQFRERQKTLTAKNYFTAKKNTKARELVRQREALIKAGVKGTSLDLRNTKGITVDTTKQVRPSTTVQSVNYQGQKELSSKVSFEDSNPKTNEYNYTPIQSVLYDSNVVQPMTAKQEMPKEVVETVKKAGIGAGVAVAGGIIIYLMGKGKIL